jgi:hypothetical protein
MSTTLTGTVHGRRIDLDSEAPIADGAPVTVHLEARRLTPEERRRIVIATAGSWRDDASLDTVFAELARRRRDTVPRQGASE